MAIRSTLEVMTDDYFKMDDGKIVDLYTETSFNLDYFLKNKKGVYDAHSGGKRIEVPLRFDGNKAGFFVRGTSLDSTKIETITSVMLDWRYIYGNATIYAIDGWENAGPEKKVDMLYHELEGAQIGMNKIMAQTLYTGLEADQYAFTGLNAICDTTATTTYAGYSSNDIVSADGTKVWTGKGSSSATALSMDAIRTIRTACAYGEGKLSEPDLVVTTEANFNKVRNILSVQQSFVADGVKTAKAGFSGVHFEGCDIYPDRYVAASNLYAINSKHFGFTVNPTALFKGLPWQIIQDSPGDKTMKIVFAGNCVCNNRRSMYRHSSIS